jgi:hypothetical protein
MYIRSAGSAEEEERGRLYIETAGGGQSGLYRAYRDVRLDGRRLVDRRAIEAGVRFIGRRFDRRRAGRWKLFGRQRSR